MLKGYARKKRILQILKKNEMEFVSAEFGVDLPSSPSGSASGFLSAQGPGVGHQTSAEATCTTFTSI